MFDVEQKNKTFNVKQEKNFSLIHCPPRQQKKKKKTQNTMNIEDTFRSYVDNSMSGTGAGRAFAPPPSQVSLPVLPSKAQAPSIGQKVWAWAKKWLGFVIFLIVAALIGFFWWKRRCGRSKRSPPTQPPPPPPNCPHAGNLQDEYLEVITESPEEQVPQVPESEDFDRVEQVVAESKAAAKQDEEEMDDFDKMAQQELKRRQESKIPERTLPNNQQAPKVDDEDFDTLANLHNA